MVREDLKTQRKVAERTALKRKEELNMAEENNTNLEQQEQNTTPTVEELQLQIKEMKAQNEKLKRSIDNACSDAAQQKRNAAEWQNKYKEKLTDEERAATEKAESEAKLMAELNAYKERDRINTYKSKYMAIGYDEATAQSLAASLPEGIGDSFFDAQKTFLENKIQAKRVEDLNRQGGLAQGTPSAQNIDPQMSQLREMMGLPPLR